jgi:hypothetical protein
MISLPYAALAFATIGSLLLAVYSAFQQNMQGVIAGIVIGGVAATTLYTQQGSDMIQGSSGLQILFPISLALLAVGAGVIFFKGISL